ncbi:hypothetical protein [Paraburkholderia sediminicola]|uniref:hypothetical protein n=1 Tax=Paraburkholderia sediminicola TaxID=458836 RepID=UPI0038BC6472
MPAYVQSSHDGQGRLVLAVGLSLRIDALAGTYAVATMKKFIQELKEDIQTLQELLWHVAVWGAI